ncbi:hypothetical protein [Ornithinimicrobium kibberense]|uniref:hypothetical protein n=1 Tax=Ornithinimicrobium kibberense TaxID=282060 RepID=UPI003622CAA2
MHPLVGRHDRAPAHQVGVRQPWCRRCRRRPRHAYRDQHRRRPDSSCAGPDPCTPHDRLLRRGGRRRPQLQR